MTNYNVRVIDRKRVVLGDNEFPGAPQYRRSVFNHVVSANSSKEARKMLRKEYGHLAIFGFIRKTKLAAGVYHPVEKRLFGEAA